MDTKIGRINYWPSTGLVMLKKQRMNIKGNRFQKLLERAEVNRDKGK
jgi:hypothetical protein